MPSRERSVVRTSSRPRARLTTAASSPIPRSKPGARSGQRARSHWTNWASSRNGIAISVDATLTLRPEPSLDGSRSRRDEEFSGSGRGRLTSERLEAINGQRREHGTCHLRTQRGLLHLAEQDGFLHLANGSSHI